MLWPLVVFLLKRRPLIGLCIGSVGISIGIRAALHSAGWSTAAYVLTPARMDALAIGALLALALRAPGGLTRLRRWAWPAAGATTLGLLLLILSQRGLPDDDLAVQTIGYTLFACLFGALLVIALAAAPGSALQRLFTAPSLRCFGRYSYGIYVFHHPLLFFLPHTLSYDSFPRIGGSTIPGQLLFILLLIGVSLGLALLSWRLFEQPFLKLKDRFPYHGPVLDKPPPAPAPATTQHDQPVMVQP